MTNKTHVAWVCHHNGNQFYNSFTFTVYRKTGNFFSFDEIRQAELEKKLTTEPSICSLEELYPEIEFRRYSGWSDLTQLDYHLDSVEVALVPLPQLTVDEGIKMLHVLEGLTY